MEDSSRDPIDPGDHTWHRMHFLTSIPEASCGTGAQ